MVFGRWMVLSIWLVTARLIGHEWAAPKTHPAPSRQPWRTSKRLTGGEIASAIFRAAARRTHRQIRRIEILTLHLHDDPVQNAVADYRPRQLSRTVLEEGRARIGRQGVTGGEQRRHLFVGKTDGRHGEQPQGLRGKE